MSLTQSQAVENQGLLYHMVTKWQLSTAAMRHLKIYKKESMKAYELDAMLALNKGRLKYSSNGIVGTYAPIYSNTSRNTIRQDAQGLVDKHQEYFLSYRYKDNETAIVLIQRSNINKVRSERNIYLSRNFDRRREDYYKVLAPTL